MSDGGPIGGFLGLEVTREPSGAYQRTTALSTGRSCLSLLAPQLGWRQVHLPFYICDATLEGLEAAEVEYRFYGLDRSLEIRHLPTVSGAREALVYVNSSGLKGRYVRDRKAVRPPPRCGQQPGVLSIEVLASLVLQLGAEVLLWPEIEERYGSGFEWEKELTHRLSPLPIDQRYGATEMHRVAEAIERLESRSWTLVGCRSGGTESRLLDTISDLGGLHTRAGAMANAVRLDMIRAWTIWSFRLRVSA